MNPKWKVAVWALLIVLALLLVTVAALGVAASREHMDYRPGGKNHSLARDLAGLLPVSPPFGLSRTEAVQRAIADVHVEGMMMTRAYAEHSRDLSNQLVPGAYWVWVVELKCHPGGNCIRLCHAGHCQARYAWAEFDYFTGDFITASISSCYNDPRVRMIDTTTCAQP